MQRCISTAVPEDIPKREVTIVKNGAFGIEAVSQYGIGPQLVGFKLPRFSSSGKRGQVAAQVRVVRSAHQRNPDRCNDSKRDDQRNPSRPIPPYGAAYDDSQR